MIKLFLVFYLLFAQAIAMKPHVLTRKTSGDGRVALVLDGAVRGGDVRILRTILSTYAAWHYSQAPRWTPLLRAAEQNSTFPIETAVKAIEVPWDAGSLPPLDIASIRVTWWTQIALKNMNASPIWRGVLKPAMERLWKGGALDGKRGDKEGGLELVDAIATMHRNGDFVVPERWVSREATSERNWERGEAGWVVAVFLNEKWHRDGYGELLVHEEEDDGDGVVGVNAGEVLLGVRPRLGRAVVFDATLPFLPRPPSVSYTRGELVLFLYIHPNPSLPHLSTISTSLRRAAELSSLQRAQARMERGRGGGVERAVVGVDGEWLGEGDEGKVGYGRKVAEKHVAQEHVVGDKSGRVIRVFDDYVDGDDLRVTREWVRASFENYHFDDTDDDGSDNVVWIASFDPDKFTRTRIWDACRAAVEASTNQTGWFPYDVAVNLIESGDKPRIHTDCMEHETENTMVLYLNEDWVKGQPFHYGETIFFTEGDDDSSWPDVKGGSKVDEEEFDSEGSEGRSVEGGMGYEVVASVRPRFGRLVLFPGTIPHSARSPSHAAGRVRLTLAVKVSPLEQIARRKSLRELVEIVDDVIKPRVIQLAKAVGKDAEGALQRIDDVLALVEPTVEAGGDVWGEEVATDAPTYGTEPGQLQEWSKLLHETVESGLWDLLSSE